MCVPNSSAERSQPVYVPRCFEVRERTAISPTRNLSSLHPRPIPRTRFTIVQKKKKKEKWMELYEDEKHLSIKNVGGVFLFFPLFANDERFYYVSRA